MQVRHNITLEDNSISSEESDSESETISTGEGGVLLEVPITTNTILDLSQDIAELQEVLDNLGRDINTIVSNLNRNSREKCHYTC